MHLHNEARVWEGLSDGTVDRQKQREQFSLLSLSFSVKVAIKPLNVFYSLILFAISQACIRYPDMPSVGESLAPAAFWTHLYSAAWLMAANTLQLSLPL